MKVSHEAYERSRSQLGHSRRVTIIEVLSPLFVLLSLLATPVYAGEPGTVHVSIVGCSQDVLEQPTLTIRTVSKAAGFPEMRIAVRQGANSVSTASLSLSQGYYWFEPRTKNCGFPEAVAVSSNSERWTTFVLEPKTENGVTIRDDHLDKPLDGAIVGDLPLPGLTVICERAGSRPEYADQTAHVFGQSYYFDALAPGEWEMRVEGAGWISQPIPISVSSAGLLIRNITILDLARPDYFHHLH